MRILLTIPHFFARQSDSKRHGSSMDSADFRRNALKRCVDSIHQHFGRPQCIMQISRRRTESANADQTAVVHVVACTVDDRHLLDDLDVAAEFLQQQRVSCDPAMLGFECRNVLRDRWGSYDWYGFLEDDLILHDPWFFAKLNRFVQQAGTDAVLLPNRFERGISQLATKAYVDGDLAERVTADFQDIHDQPEIRSSALGVPVTFCRPTNPHSGCWFLNSEQFGQWMKHPSFADRQTSFVGPLESAATLSLMRSFRIYKPHRSVASFLEIEHAGQRFISQLRRSEQE